MQWSDVTRTQSPRTLREFGLLSLVVFGGWAAWRAYSGRTGPATLVLGSAGLVLGGLALAVPMALRPVFTAWMALAFPIGWVVSRVVLAALYYAVFTPIAIFFRLVRRDVLHRRRRSSPSYWTPKAKPADSSQYFKQF